MSAPLDVQRCGAVTAVGLSAAQTCAAIRARISGVADVFPAQPPKPPVAGARVPAAHELRRSPARWLANLAARAVRECLGAEDAARTALVLSVPEAYRRHPGLAAEAPGRLLEQVEARLGVRFHPSSRVVQDGHAGAASALALARELLGRAELTGCIVGGVDSLLNAEDVGRLQAAFRLKDANEPQGVIPGEGAACVLVTRADERATPLARVVGVGLAQEPDTALGPRFSQGRGIRRALEAALRDARVAEASLDWRVSDMNGERYRAWETLLTEFRFYRTRRESFSPTYFAASVGDLGAAAGALGLVTAVAGLSRGWAPGPRAVCEASSDEGLRGAVVVDAPREGPRPPFRAGAGWPAGFCAVS